VFIVHFLVISKGMGIDTRWKVILKNNFEGFCSEIPSGIKITKIIDDMSLNIRSILTGVNTWQDLKKNSMRRVESFWTPSLEEYVVLFDERQYVPDSKIPTQTKRTNNEKHPPFTSEEIRYINIGTGDIPPDKATFLKRMMATRELHGQLYDLVGSSIASSKFGNKRVRMIIDGGFEKGVLQMRDKIKVVSIHPHVSDDGSCERYDTATKYIIISTSDDDSLSTAYIMDSERIGESDLKIPKHIDSSQKGNIFVRSKDTDSIPIILLHMRDWINTESGSINFGIYLELSSAKQGKEAEIVDMVKLWRSIIIYFRSNFNNVPCPIETIVMLMLYNGCDYCQKYRKITPAVIWKMFCDGGNKILFDSGKNIM
jgi:hypothetical protein